MKISQKESTRKPGKNISGRVHYMLNKYKGHIHNVLNYINPQNMTQ